MPVVQGGIRDGFRRDDPVSTSIENPFSCWISLATGKSPINFVFEKTTDVQTPTASNQVAALLPVSTAKRSTE